MDHDDALEALQLAAAEPGGLERLMAGDTPQAAALVGHLAGCDACSTELERLRRGVPMLRDVVRTTPPADLRERTLAFVREQGIQRPVVATTSVAEPVAIPVAAAAASTPSPAVVRSRPSILPWVASIAAAVLLSVAASTLIIGARVDEQLAAQDRAIAGLETVTSATLAITAEPDAERVSLVSSDGSPSIYGSLLFSPSTTELVVVADGLTEPPAGQEYRCWLVVDGTRQDVGKMFFADDLAFWAGDTPEVAALAKDTTFGVSLTQVDAPSLDADPVIVGTL